MSDPSSNSRLIGDVLSAARAAKGVSLEDAAFATRIRVRKLREIEANDFTRFPHPSYVRLYLLDYAKYLGVPSAGILDLLPQQGSSNSFGAHYISIAHAHHRPRATPSKKRVPVATIALGLVVLLLVVAVGFYGMKLAAALEKAGTSHTTASHNAVTSPAELLRSGEVSPRPPAGVPAPSVGRDDDRALLSGTRPGSAQ